MSVGVSRVQFSVLCVLTVSSRVVLVKLSVPLEDTPPRSGSIHGLPPLGDGDASRVARRAVLGAVFSPSADHALPWGGIVPRCRLPAAPVVAEGAGEGAGVGGGHRGAAIGAHRNLSGGDRLKGVDLGLEDGTLGPRDRDLRARRGPVDLGQSGDALRAATSQGGPIRSRTCVPRVFSKLREAGTGWRSPAPRAAR